MKRICALVAACGLLFSASAGAARTTYTIQTAPTFDWDAATLQYFAADSTIAGHFTIDDTLVEASPGHYEYAAAFSGTFRLGGNTLAIADSLAYVHDYEYATDLTMLGGNRWNTGGTLVESAPSGGIRLTGLQVRFMYQDRPPIDTPIGTLLGMPTDAGSVALAYEAADGSTGYAWWRITAVSAVPEPASVTMLLAGGALLAGSALRRRGKAPAHEPRPQ